GGPGGALQRYLTVAQALRVDGHIHAHQMGTCLGRMLVPDQRVCGDALDVARVFPHLEIELHAIVDEEMDAQGQRPIGDNEGDEEDAQADAEFAKLLVHVLTNQKLACWTPLPPESTVKN